MRTAPSGCGSGSREPPLTATWVNVAFSYRGRSQRSPARREADTFGDQSFRQGLAARSTYLGDPTDPAHPGHRSRWVVGGPDNEADVLVIVAADEPSDLEDAVARPARPPRTGCELVFEQRGDTLPGTLRGHEHFGFKDGISQPGVRGQGLARAGRLHHPALSRGRPTRTRGCSPSPDSRSSGRGSSCSASRARTPQDPFAPAPRGDELPGLGARAARTSSCRRLRQDVVGVLGRSSPTPRPQRWALTAGARRRACWSGAGRAARRCCARRPPTTRRSAGDEFANNHFLFDDDTRPSLLRPIAGYAGDTLPPAAADILGAVCPHAAHIRKVNPRDSGTDFGAPADTLLRLMLRRGIPFGPPVAGVDRPGAELVDAGARADVRRATRARSRTSSSSSPGAGRTRRCSPNVGGHDPIIGQADRRGDRTAGSTARRSEWVTPTGGGYFFAPPISAIADVLGAEVPDSQTRSVTGA